MENPFTLAERAATQLCERSGVDHYDLAVVLGSGWKEGADALGPPTSVIETSSLSGFAAPTVAGHSGEILTVEVAGMTVALVSGRVHLYEGHNANDVVHPVRTVIAAGAKKVVLTNASGGVDPLVPPGSVVIIRDHLNFTGTSPLEGPLERSSVHYQTKRSIMFRWAPHPVKHTRTVRTAREKIAMIAPAKNCYQIVLLR